ncbi:MAG TPA: hypothetical protein VFI25_04555 [Planctomycetota bacterium]|jgi:hypothetical protein|nr:hypothetical protein [Planctomycetota bacterium]
MEQVAEKTTEARPTTAIRSFREVLTAVVGKTVTIVNPESYEESALGAKLTMGIYKGKVLALGDDFLKVQTTFKRRGGKDAADEEPVVQFVPIDRVKRVSVMKTDTILHI